MSNNDNYSGTITAAAQTVTADCNNTLAAYVIMNGATHVGANMAFEATNDGGVTWQSVLGFRLDSAATQTVANSTSVISSGNSVQYYVFLGGFKQFRVRASAFTSGTMNVSIQTVDDADPILPFTPGFTAPSSQNDGAANPSVGTAGANQFEFNGTTWDRVRGNASAVAVDLTAARTANGTGVTATNYDATGAFIQVNVTAVSGSTPTAVFKVQYSVDGTNFIDLDATNAATASITATGQYVIKVFPGIPTVAAGSCNSPLPRTWRLAWTIGGSTPSFTFVSHVTYIRG